MKLVVQELTIEAPLTVVYEYLTDGERFVEWMADTATLVPASGGQIRWTHANGDTCSGAFVELVPHRRVVFTDGWERPDVEIPPGSTTVEIDLHPDGPDATRLRLASQGTPPGHDGDVLECVVYGTVDGVGRDELLAAADGISAWARAQPGFVSRELFEVGDGRWIDILRWSTIEHALAASERTAESEACARYFATIDDASVLMLHGHPVLDPVRA